MHGRFDDTLHFTPAGSNLLIVAGPLVAEEPGPRAPRCSSTAMTCSTGRSRSTSP